MNLLRRIGWRRVDPAADIEAGRRIEERVRTSVAWNERGPHLARAVEHYLAAAAAAPWGGDLWREAAFAAGCLLAGEHAIRDLDRAVPLLEAVVASSAGPHPAYYYLGEALVMGKDFDHAEAVFRCGLALDPGDRAIVDVLRHLPIDRVHEAARRADWPAVVAAVDRIPPAERSAEAWLLLGDAHRELGAPAAAAAAWRTAMRREPLKGMRRRFQSIGEPYPDDSPAGE